MNGENYKYFKDIYDKMLVMQKEIYKLVEILRKNEKITDKQFSDVLNISAEMVANDDTIKAAKSVEPHPDGVTFVFDPEKVDSWTANNVSKIDFDKGFIVHEMEKLNTYKPGRQNGKKAAAEDVARNLAKRWTLAAASSTPNTAARDLLLQAFAELEKDERDTNPEV